MVARLANTALGIWLMAAPSVLGYGGPAADNHRIFGPMAASFAIIAIAQATREVRWANAAIGAWLAAAPWLLGYPAAATWNSIASGLLMAALAAWRGRVDKEYAGGWMSLVKRGQQIS